MSIKPITDTIRLLEDGQFNDRASELLAALVKAVDETDKTGAMTITLKLKKSGGAVAIAADVKTKVPEPKADETLLWPTVEGNLQLTNPNQRTLDLRAVPEGKQPARTIDQETGEIRTA